MRQLIVLLLLVPGMLSGQDYFQQRVDYTIQVSLDDKEHVLHGQERFVYTNNAPSSLDTLYIHLWPNAYKNNETALAKQLLSNGNYDFYYSTANERGFIDSLDFTNDESQPYSWSYHPEHIDIAVIALSEPLKPGAQLTVNTPFRVKIPDGKFSRLGHVGESYQITQWYPKPAVYDNDGWHAMPYLNQGEFYSEFGSFEVKITVPENYVLGATGTLQEESERQWLLEKAAYTDSLIDAVKEANSSAIRKRYLGYEESSSETKTLTFVAENVHDFAWFADKRWFVLKGEVELPHSGKKVDLWSMFTANELLLWMNSIEYLHDAAYYYSLWNGDYPYDHITAVDGTISAGGGMEYPNITVIGTSGSALGLETVIMHEVGHNWFYGILGTNERAHAWMDEGLNSLNESRYIATKYPNLSLGDGLGIPGKLQRRIGINMYKQQNQYDLFYTLAAARNIDQPIELPADEYTQLNYGGIVYSKTAVVFNYLLNYLGVELFDQCMQTYYDRWKFKHPGPEDLQAVFEEVTGKDLHWFFHDLIQTTKKIDYKISGIKKGDDLWGDVTLKVKQKGGVNGPFSVSNIREGAVDQTFWFDSIPKNKRITVPMPEGTEAFRIDPQMIIPEVNRRNNTIRTTGPLKKAEPFRLQFLAGVENPEKSQAYWLPLISGNAYDGFLLGFGLHNFQIPTRRVEWGIFPMYGFRSEGLRGSALLRAHLIREPNKLLRHTDLTLDLKGFGIDTWEDDDLIRNQRFIKSSVGINFTFNTKLNSPHAHRAMFKSSVVQELYNRSGLPVLNRQDPWTFTDVHYEYKNNHPILPFRVRSSYRLGIQNQPSGDLYKLSSFELNGNLRYRYHKNGYGINLRVFAGHYFANNTNQGQFNYQLDGPGAWLDMYSSDFRYEYFYLGRNETAPNFFGQQVVLEQGGFISTTRYSDNKSMIAANLTARVPIPIGISGFYNVAILPGAIEPVFQEVGVKLNIIKNFVDLYLPLWSSQQLQDETSLNDLPYLTRIRFTLNIHAAQLNNLVPFL